MTDDRSAALLGEIALEAGMERTSFLNDAADQLDRFLKANADRLKTLGGMVLIDDDPDYLSVAPDGTFRSRTRYQDATSGEWISETEVIESAAELVELYNPADVYAAFAEAAREEAGLPNQPTGAESLLGDAGLAQTEGVGVGIGGADPYIGAADEWAATQSDEDLPEDQIEIARRMYDLALTFQERSQLSEARLIEQFEVAASALASRLGDQLILDDEDERLWFKASGSFEAEVLPERDEDDEDAGQWVTLKAPEEMVQFYDPTDLFGDLAETIAEQYPEVAPETDEDAEA
jgi:hypothetical protein